MDSCSFEQPNICGMIQGQDAKAKWVRTKSVAGGASTDHTNMGQCNGMNIIYYSWKQLCNFYNAYTVLYWSWPTTDNTYLFSDKIKLGWKVKTLLFRFFFF